jgi:uncharacterized protein YegP (UPF0339 family)
VAKSKKQLSGTAISVLVGLPDGSWRIHIVCDDGVIIRRSEVYPTMRAAEDGLQQVHKDYPDIRIL